MMDWLPEGDIVHLIVDAVAMVDLDAFEAGYRLIAGDAIPDHTVIARFRQRHAARMREVFLAVLRLCHETGLVRLGRVALGANRAAGSIDEQVAWMLAEAEAADAQEDGRSGAQRAGELPTASARSADRLAPLQQCQDKLRRQAAEAASHRQKIDARCGGAGQRQAQAWPQAPSCLRRAILQQRAERYNACPSDKRHC